jgi:Cupin-like domain
MASARTWQPLEQARGHRVSRHPPGVASATAELLAPFVYRRQPALFARAVPASVCQAWSPDALKATSGDLIVRIEKSAVGTQVPAFGKNGGRFERVRQPLGSVVDALNEPGPPYLYASSLRVHQDLPQMVAHLPALGLPLAGAPEPILFLGQQGTGSHWHYDASYNFLLVLHGVKVAILRSPSAFRELAPTPFWAPLPHFSSRGVGDQGASSTGLTVRLEPGDGLFIPPGWWHQVRNESPSVSVTYTYPLPRRDLLRWRFLRLWVSHRLIHPRG